MSDLDDADRPATFREVLASGEFRALYVANVLSWFGDYVAKAAVTALVYRQTNSVAASAAAFAISFLPWLGLGPILAALAERLPFRRTMVVADLLRMVLIALVALPNMHSLAMILLLFATAVCNPPFDAARSALLPKVLDGDRYVVGLTLQTTSVQVAQIVGYLSGATLATINPRGALLFDAATFGVSALIIAVWVQPRPSALPQEDRSDLLQETANGMRLVFGTPVLRSIALVVLACSLFAVVPEGLAAAWAVHLTKNEAGQGWTQGGIMISHPVGFIVGGLVVARLLRPNQRQRIIPVFAVAVPAALVPALLDPSALVVYGLSFLSGAATAGLLPPTNALFVQALPDSYRARAFGVIRSGIQVIQGVAVFATGGLADHFQLATVVGLWGLGGVALMTGVVLAWPKHETITDELARVKDLNAARGAPPGPNDGPTVELRKPSPRPRPTGAGYKAGPPQHGPNGPSSPNGQHRGGPPSAPARIEPARPGRHRAEDRPNGTAPGLPSRAGTMER